MALNEDEKREIKLLVAETLKSVLGSIHEADDVEDLVKKINQSVVNNAMEARNDVTISHYENEMRERYPHTSEHVY